MKTIDKSVVRHLNAADGYLELGMPIHALRELAEIENAGPLQAAVDFMTGLAFKDSQNYDEAIDWLHRAATEIPAPHNGDAWELLSECYRLAGYVELADVTQMFAEDSGIPADWELDSPGPDHADLLDEEEILAHITFSESDTEDFAEEHVTANVNMPK